MQQSFMRGLSDLLTGTGRRRRAPSLGQRELAVLEILWESGAETAQAVRDSLPGEPVSLSTVQSTLERLHRKHLLERRKDGRAFIYAAALTRNDLIRNLMHDIATELAAGETAPMISGFLDYLGESGARVTLVTDSDEEG